MKSVRTIFRPPSVVHRPSSIVLFVAVVIFLVGCPASALIEFKDGLTHNIDYYILDFVFVDYQTPYMYTTVNVLTGGRMIHPLVGYEHSRINIRGGVLDWLASQDSSLINISSGLIIKTLRSYDSSQVDISGGSISHIETYGSSQIDISGGQIDCLMLSDRGNIRIFGSDFAVDGQPFGYGELTSIYGGWYLDEPYRRLTGTLLSGELIDNVFYIGYDARIILTIPEPATLALLGIGGLVLRKRC